MEKKWMVYTSWAAALATGLVGGIALAQIDGKGTGMWNQWLTGGAGRTAEVLGKPYELVLARSYLCGVKDEEHKPVAVDRLAEMMVEYNGWEIVTADPTKMILMKRENDIAPACKDNGHFGISTDGMLTLFNGLPEEHHVVQTFYRMNTKKMEASLSREEVEKLKRGIRVRDLAEYNSVLSTYGEFQLSMEE